MGLLDFFRKHDAYEKAVLKIADIISAGDKAVIKKLRECFPNPRKYASAHLQQYVERSVDIQTVSERRLIWFAMADCLISHGYAQEFDWNCNKDDFIALLSTLKHFENSYEINPVLLYDDDDISSWCAAQEKVWFTKHICIGGIDIGSDSYILFLSPQHELDTLIQLADSIHRRIAHGHEL